MRKALAAYNGMLWENLEVQKGLATQTADVGYWYGKVRWANNSGSVIAQDYYGFEKQYTTTFKIVGELRIVDTKTGKVIFNLPSNLLQNASKNSIPAETLKLQDFGNF